MRSFWQQSSNQPIQHAKQDDESPIAFLRKSLSADSLTRPTTLLSTAILTTGILLSTGFYRTRLRRIPNAHHLPAQFLPAQTSSSPFVKARYSLFGRVTTVGDADNFRIFHTPGGVFAFWPPFSVPFLRRHVPSSETVEGRKQLRDETVHVRIAGIDAPELAHFGRPAQPHSEQSLQWLKNQIEGRRVGVYTYCSYMFYSVVAWVALRRWWGLGVGWPRRWQRDVGLEMVQDGWAGVYEAKTGSCFDSESGEKRLRQAENEARQKGRGMWKGVSGSVSNQRPTGLWARIKSMFGTQQENEKYESPREYKTRMKKMDEQKHSKSSPG